MQINVYQFILYRNLVVLIQPQNLFKMFSHILEKYFPKADMCILQ